MHGIYQRYYNTRFIGRLTLERGNKINTGMLKMVDSGGSELLKQLPKPKRVLNNKVSYFFIFL